MGLGAITTTTDPATVADRLQTYFSKKLLKVQTDTLVMDQFGMKAELPKNSKSKTIRFFKPEKASQAYLKDDGLDTTNYSVQSLTEGTPPSYYRQNTWTYVDATLAQYGEVTKISDVVRLIDAYEPLRQNIALMGRDAALSADTITRNSLHTGANDDDGANGCELFVLTTGGALGRTSDSGTDFTTLLALTQAQAKMTRLGILTAVTGMKVRNAPTFRGNRYICAISPQVSLDLFQDSSYSNYAMQSLGQSEGFWKGQLGSLDGVDFVEHTNPFIENDTYKAYGATDSGTAGLVYSTYVIGEGAYGIPKLSGSTSPFMPQVVVNDKPDKSDPLNQFCIAGWKAFYTAIALDKANYMIVRTKSSYA